MKKRNLLERLKVGSVICAEGFLFEAERRGYLASGEFVPELALENPEALKNIHKDFQHAGSDVVEAFTYNGHREKMRVIGKEQLLESLNRSALKIAKEVADDVKKDQEKNLLAGNISNTNIWDPNDKAKQKEVRNMFNEMIGWSVEEGEAPELDHVYEIWGKILMQGSSFEESKDVVKPETLAYLQRLTAVFDIQSLTLDEAMIERRRLRRLWSAFLTEYTVAVGPTWATLPWPIDTDLDPDKGIGVLRDSWPFIAPGNVLGIPSVALPTGVSDGLPTGIQVYAELYREDLCLLAAEMIESESHCPTPIEPVR